MRISLVLATLIGLALFACREGSPAAADPPTAATPSPAPADAELFTRSRPLMGTVYRISVVGVSAERAEPAVRAALDEIARLERVLSEWIPESEISRINASAGKAPVEVGSDNLAVIRAGLDVSRWSDGAFDLSWAALHGLYDFRPGRTRIPSAAELKSRLPLIGYENIVFDEAKQTVFLRKKGMAIGTGGIAKGYALDRAGAILERAGIRDFMLFGGGQVQVRGHRGDRPWRVGIQHPRRLDEYFAFFEHTDGSISTSGDYEHFHVDEDGKRWHHILDLDTGLPARKARSVTVVAQAGIYADALSTAAFVLGPEKALELVQKVSPPAELVMVDADCRVVATPGLRAKLQLRVTLGPNDTLPGCVGEE